MAKNYTTEETSENFETWINKEFISEETRRTLVHTNILFVPTIGYKDEGGPIFPTLTEDIVNYFREHSEEDINLGLCVDIDKYRELALHGDYKRLGNFVVKEIILPVFIGILSSYLYDKFIHKDEQKPQIIIVKEVDNSVHKTHIEGSHKKYHSPTRVTFSITIVSSDGKSKKVTYEGPAKEVKEVLEVFKSKE